jgi:hypothetical protein
LDGLAAHRGGRQPCHNSGSHKPEATLWLIKTNQLPNGLLLGKRMPTKTATPPLVKVQVKIGAPTFEELFEPARLRQTAITIRKEVRLLRARDAVDWIDWFISLEGSLTALSQDIISGSYTPSAPTRYELAKSHGAYRVITAFNMRDAIVYRHICDEALLRAMPNKVPGAFFSRRHSVTSVGNTLTLDPNDYHTFFEIWLKFNQYRSHTLLNNAYQVLVVTDITNYFDSVQHDLLIEYLSPFQLPRKAMGLLGRLLEAFKPASGHSPNPRVGLAIDELDCSRELAHLFLFEHDSRIVAEFGESNYVRWLDDQNIGVRSMTEARRAVNALTRSLSSQRLTVNAGKTKFLTPPDVVKHFQLDANEEIDRWDQTFKSVTSSNLALARAELRSVWNRISLGDYVGVGNWSKILKRMYAAATKADSDLFEGHVLEHLIQYPELDERLFQYLARRNLGSHLLSVFSAYCLAGENLFEATESAFFESVLLLDPSPRLSGRIRKLASLFATGTAPGQSGKPLGRASAILALYWFGEAAWKLELLFDTDSARRLPKEVARAWIASVAALRPALLSRVQSKLVGHQSDDVARLSSFVSGLLSGTVSKIGNYKTQKKRWPLPGKYYDARSWLLLHIASSSPHKVLRAQLHSDFKTFQPLARTIPEKRVAAKIQKRLR